MTRRKDRPENAADPSASSGQALRLKADAIVQEKEARAPENLETLSPEEARRLLHDLQVHQIEMEKLRRTQAELDASRARYFDLYDLAPVGYITLSEQGLILEANLTIANLLGAARGELIRQPLSKFILAEDKDIYYRHRTQLFQTGELQACELRLLKKDIDPIWARMEAVVARDAAGAPECRMAVSNITERKQAEKKLREGEKQYRGLIDQFLIGIGLSRGNEMIYANPALLQIFGYDDLEEFAKIPLLDLGESPGSAVEHNILTKDGITKTLYVYKTNITLDGEIYTQTVFEDITKLRRAEAASKESEERSQLAMEATGHSVWELDWTNGRFYLDEKMIHSLGYQPGEIDFNLEWWRRSIHPDSLPVIRQYWLDHREGKREYIEVDYRIRTKSGDWIWISSRGKSTKFDDKGQPARLTGINRDISNLKRAEEALEERVRLARDLHDGLLQSLAAAALQLETIHRLMATQPQTARKRLADIQQMISVEQRNLRYYIQELKLSNTGLPESREDIEERLQDLADRFEHRQGPRVQLEVKLYQHQLPWAVAQGVYFIVREALNNAARHAEASRVQADISSEDRRVHIVIADNGHGFSFRGRHNHAALTAMDLGPATIRQRVASLGGELTVESGASGARLEIALPIAE